MDIHKPKPWHGGRELLKEIGTIVIGVLIALGAEQTVEWLHRQNEVAEAREALKDEMGRNATYMMLNTAEAPCVKADLDRVAAWINGGPPPHWNPGRLGVLDTSVWDEARTSAVPLMPFKQRIAYDRFYAAVANRQDTSRRERDEFAGLARYSGQTQVPPEARFQALQEVSGAKVQVNVLVRLDEQLLAMARTMGVSPRAFSAEQAAGLERLCNGTEPPLTGR
jgi:hypothetical protein